MVPNWMILTVLGLVVASWFLIGEKKSFGEKIGTVLFFLALYVLYRILNTPHATEVIAKFKHMLGMY